MPAMGRTDIQLATRLVASRDHVSCEVEDEMVILSLHTGEYYGLNPVALRVWSLLEQPRSVAEVRDVLLAEYAGVTPEECTEQLLGLLADMVELRLVELP